MKSKKFILQQIKDLLDSRGKDGAAYVEGLGDRTVYELLVIKKDITEERCEDDDDDVHPHHWYKKDMRDYYNDDAPSVGTDE